MYVAREDRLQPVAVPEFFGYRGTATAPEFRLGHPQHIMRFFLILAHFVRRGTAGDSPFQLGHVPWLARPCAATGFTNLLT